MSAGPRFSAPSRVGVVKLTLTDFRSYDSARLQCDLRPVVLTGPNGAGKTNLLEALSFLAPGRGLRRAPLHEIARRRTPALLVKGGWAVAAEVTTPCGPISLGVGREPGDPDRRIVRINGRAARTQAELGDVISTVWLTPSMDRLFTESAAGRRHFLDRLVFGLYPDHAARLSAYGRAQRQRARLLRDGGADDARRRTWCEGLEEAMAAHGVAVAAARRDAAARLSRALLEAEGPFPRADIALLGFAEELLETHSALAAEDALRDHLGAMRAKERAGAPTDGPHRSDLIVRCAKGGRPASQCSTGEQKAMLLAILLAQARVQGAQRGAAPLLLLDEVAAHLDSDRRSALYDALTDLGAQAWLTGTERVFFRSFKDRAQFFEVVDGGFR